jgi:phosphoglycerol transferase
LREPWLPAIRGNWTIWSICVTDTRKGNAGRLAAYGLAAYGSAFALSLVILSWSIKLQHADLATPFSYSDDGLAVQAYIKTGIENHWYWHNHDLGMPGTLYLTDYPAEVSASFLLLLIKLLSALVGDSAQSMNLFYLATFPLITLSALFVLRSFRLSYAPAVVMSLLYAFLPYHFFRGEAHLFLAAYFTVPFMILLILWSYLDEPLFFRLDASTGRARPSLRAPRSLASLVLCVLIGCSQIYYAFFTCYFLILAGVTSSLCKKRLHPLASALLLVTTISFVGLVNFTPVFWYDWKFGRNQTVERSPAESECQGMKIVQLLLPVEGHRLPFFSNMKERYNQTAPLLSENRYSTLGCVGSLGFLLLVGRLFYRKSGAWHFTLLDKLSVLNLGAVLLGTIGGFGSLVAYLGSPWFRCYTRISIFIGFLALFAVGLLLDKLLRRYARSIPFRIGLYGLLGGLLAAGSLDQTAWHYPAPYALIQRNYQADAEFVAAIENSVPPHAMIFQLPYVYFPNGAGPNRMQALDHLRGYLHSKTLRWSFPTMVGRDIDRWQRRVAADPNIVQELIDAGFDGIYINRDGFADRAASLETTLARLVDARPIVSSNGQLAFFNLDKAKHKIAVRDLATPTRNPHEY